MSTKAFGGINGDGSIGRRTFVQTAVAAVAANSFFGFLNPLLAQSASSDSELKCTAPMTSLSHKYQIDATSTGHEMIYDAVLKGSNAVTSKIRLYMRTIENAIPLTFSIQLAQQWFRPDETAPGGEGSYNITLTLTKGDLQNDGIHRSNMLDMTLVNPHGTVIQVPTQTLITKVSDTPWAIPTEEELETVLSGGCHCGSTPANSKSLIPAGTTFR